MYRLFLSFRFLLSRKINFLAVLGVAVGVMALIVVTSVMRGFEREIRGRIRGTLSHVVCRAINVNGFLRYEEHARKIEAIPGVIACAPRFDRYGLMTRGTDNFSHVQIKGVDLAAELRTTEFREHLLVKDNARLRQSVVQYYERVTEKRTLHSGLTVYSTRLVPKQVDIRQEMMGENGLTIVEVSSIEEAIRYMIG